MTWKNRTHTLILGLALLLLAGCRPSGRQATLVSSESFAEAVSKRLDTKGVVEHSPAGSGRAGNAFDRDFTHSISASSFSPDALYELAKDAMGDWGQHGSFSTRGHSGGGNRFSIHYGTNTSHAFIDIIAYPDKDRTRIDVLIRVLE